MIDLKRYEYRVNAAQNQGLRSRSLIRQKEEIMASHDTVMNAFFHNYAKMLWEKSDTYAFLHDDNEKRHVELIMQEYLARNSSSLVLLPNIRQIYH